MRFEFIYSILLSTSMPTNTHHKLFMFLISILGVSGMILGIYRVYDAVYGTFRVPEDELVSLTELENQNEEQFVSSILTLQTQDTDDDGITDYEELYNYGTSLYLKDSDSDGLNDLTELKSGADPMCHKDKNCASSPSSSEDILNELQGQFSAYPSAQDEVPVAPSGIGAQGTGALSGAQLRELLEQSGFPRDQLDTLTDEELEKKWNEVTGKQ